MESSLSLSGFLYLSSENKFNTQWYDLKSGKEFWKQVAQTGSPILKNMTEALMLVKHLLATEKGVRHISE
jgi:hypothetical protein